MISQGLSPMLITVVICCTLFHQIVGFMIINNQHQSQWNCIHNRCHHYCTMQPMLRFTKSKPGSCCFFFFTIGPYPQRANEAAHLVLPGAIGFGKSTQIERRGVCAHMSSPKCIIRVNKPLFKNMSFQHARDAC